MSCQCTQRRLGLYPTAILGTVFNAVCLLGFATTERRGALPSSGVLLLVLSRAGVAIKGACTGPITAHFADATNRGAVFARVRRRTKRRRRRRRQERGARGERRGDEGRGGVRRGDVRRR